MDLFSDGFEGFEISSISWQLTGYETSYADGPYSSMTSMNLERIIEKMPFSRVSFQQHFLQVSVALRQKFIKYEFFVQLTEIFLILLIF